MNIPITIVLDGTVNGQRKWSSVPRIGEIVLVGSTDPLKPHRARVTNVVWLNESDPRVELICKKEK